MEEDAGVEEDAGSDAGETTSCESVAVTIANRHGHEMPVSAADVAAGVERSYEIRGAGTHPHSVVVTAAQFAMLAAGETVTVMSTRNSGHDHMITLVCG